MPPRAAWKGHMKLSLVSFAVRVYNATTSSGKVTLNQLHKDCHQRLKQKLACPEHGEVDRTDIVKGYEFERGRYVVVEPEDLERVQLETTKTIDITDFVEAAELDPIYRATPYYVAPDGPVAEEAFQVIREALRVSEKIAIGRFVIAGKEHIVAIEVEGRGLQMTTLRSGAEVRSSEPYFEEIAEAEIDKHQLEMAEQLMKSKAGTLDPARFKDRYQEALLDVIKAKLEGREPAVIQDEQAATAFSFMEALKASIDETGAKPKTRGKKKPPAKSVKKTARKTKKQA